MVRPMKYLQMPMYPEKISAIFASAPFLYILQGFYIFHIRQIHFFVNLHRAFLFSLLKLSNNRNLNCSSSSRVVIIDNCI